MARTALISIAAACALAQPPPAAADPADGMFYGLLRSRDLSPFGFLRLDMRPAHAVSIEPGTWAFETELDYQNTWALSPEVEDYLVALEPSGRRKIGPAEVQAIRDLPGENYLLDIEAATLAFTAALQDFAGVVGLRNPERRLVRRTGSSTAPSRVFTTRFGFSSFGRPAVARNQTTLVYDLKGSQAQFLDRPHGWRIPRSGHWRSLLGRAVFAELAPDPGSRGEASGPGP